MVRTHKYMSVLIHSSYPLEVREAKKRTLRERLAIECMEEHLGIISMNEIEFSEGMGLIRLEVEVIGFPYKNWDEVGG